MAIGIITGSGTYALPAFDASELVEHRTPHGDVAITRGTFAGVSALHVSRHGAGHARLSNHVTHRANIWALKDLGATAVIGCTA
jgi:purine nucleoside phosphorylase